MPIEKKASKHDHSWMEFKDKARLVQVDLGFFLDAACFLGSDNDFVHLLAT